MIKVLLVDDHDLVRTGLRKLLEDDVVIDVCGEAGTGEQAIAMVRDLAPDVVLMDVNMPGIGGLEATRQISRMPGRSRVIVISMHTDGVYPKKLLEAGATGYLTKGCSFDEVISAVKTVAAGHPYISRDVAQTLVMERLNHQEDPADTLSQRELQVMRMVTQGCSNQQISERLHLSPKTVSTYRSRIYTKLGVNSDVELTHLAYRHGIIDPATGDLSDDD